MVIGWPSGSGQPEGPAELVCSAKGCRAPAAYDVLWNNPKIHTRIAASTGSPARTTATR